MKWNPFADSKSAVRSEIETNCDQIGSQYYLIKAM